mmetsp:Transcript_3512/g.8313  ORF Transcript_3512/g.8313 Transcript_3512/m.8313 type:complete len:217 (-) Transcript_3512:55-705(-)
MAARAVAGSAFSSAAAGVTAGARGASGGGINWEDFNYPCGREPCNLLHFDLQELEVKNGEHVTSIVRLVYRWWQLSFVIVCVNFINTFILALGVGDAAVYNGVNIVYALFNLIIASVCGLYAVYNVYKGLAVPSPKSKKWGMVVMVVLLVLSFLQIIMAAGNTNGFANLGSDRMTAAELLQLGIVGYWTAMTVIESLAWTAAFGLGVFAFWRLFKF